MSSMYNRILMLCNERGIKPGRVCSDTGLSRGLMSDLKMGRTKELSAKNTKIIADYFNVSTDYLLGNVSEPFFYLDNDRIKKEINSYGDEDEKAPAQEGGREIKNEDIRAAFFGGADDLSEEEMDAMWNDAKDYIQYKLDQRRRRKNGRPD